MYGETFSDVHKKKSTTGKISLRRSQFQAAAAGNVSMLIWLGKQYLEQKEPKQELAVSNVEDESVKEMEEYFGKRKEEEDTNKERTDVGT